MNRVRVVGLDVALASTGITRATVTANGVEGSHTIAVGRSLEETATLAERAQRLDYCRGAVLDEIAPPTGSGDARRTPDLVVVEGPAFAANDSGADELSGLRWLLFVDLYALGVPVAVCAPSTLKVYAVGHGGSRKTPVRKTHIVEAARRHYGSRFDLGPGDGIGDRADSVVLAALGSRWLGYPIDELGTQHTRALDSVRWPYPTEGTHLP